MAERETREVARDKPAEGQAARDALQRQATDMRSSLQEGVHGGQMPSPMSGTFLCFDDPFGAIHCYPVDRINEGGDKNNGEKGKDPERQYESLPDKRKGD